MNVRLLFIKSQSILAKLLATLLLMMSGITIGTECIYIAPGHEELAERVAEYDTRTGAGLKFMELHYLIANFTCILSTNDPHHG